MFKNLKYTQVKIASLSFSWLAVFIVLSNSILAFKPPKLSDYQRKDLAELGITKVILIHEQSGNIKKYDTLSIRVFDTKGFLLALDTFRTEKDLSRNRFLTRRISYNKDGAYNLARIKLWSISGDVVMESTLIQKFDDTDKLVEEIGIYNLDTGVTKYKYNTEGFCVEKRVLGKGGYVDSIEYKTGEGKYVRIEEVCNGSKRDYSSYCIYNSAGRPLDCTPGEFGYRTIYAYDVLGKLSRKTHFFNEGPFRGCEGSGSLSKRIEFYEYNAEGNIIKYKWIRMKPKPGETKLENDYEYTENLKYLPNGLLESVCYGEGGCDIYKYI